MTISSGFDCQANELEVVFNELVAKSKLCEANMPTSTETGCYRPDISKTLNIAKCYYLCIPHCLKSSLF